MNGDPESCPHCGITWLNKPIPGGSTQGSHYGANMAILSPARGGADVIFVRGMWSADAVRHLELRLQAGISRRGFREQIQASRRRR